MVAVDDPVATELAAETESLGGFAQRVFAGREHGPGKITESGVQGEGVDVDRVSVPGEQPVYGFLPSTLSGLSGLRVSPVLRRFEAATPEEVL